MKIFNTRTISSPISSPFGIAGSRFNPLNWFKKGEPGAWYDPSDFQPNWRRNLLTYTEDFSNAAWSKVGATVSGTNIITTSAGGAYLRQQLPNYSSIVRFALLCRIPKTVGSTRFPMTSIALQGGTSTYAEVILDTNTGLAQPRAGLADNFPTNITSVDKGSYWELSYSLESRSGNIAVSLYLYPTVSSDGSTYNSTLTGSVTIDAAQLEQSSSASTYQKITDGIQDYYTVQPQPVLFQDSAGTTPVTAVEQPVGLMLDKSKGLALGAELNTGGSNAWTAYGTTLLSTGTLLTITNNATGNGYAYKSFTTEIGKTYTLTTSFYPVSGSGPAYIFSGNSIGAANNGSVTLTLSGDKRFIFSATATITYISLYAFGGVIGNSSSFDNISVKQIAGNHAFQATTVNKPLLSARVNSLIKTEDFSDGVWVKANSSTVTGTNTLNLPIDGSYIYQLNTAPAGVQLTLSATLSGTGTVSLVTYDNVSSFQFNSITLTSTPTQYFFPVTLGSGATDRRVGIGRFNTDTATLVTVNKVDARPTNAGALLPPYQRVTTASDYDTIGFPLYLACNGTVSSRSMSTNSIDFTGTDKMTVVTGVRKLSDATIQIALELSVIADSNNGTFLLAPSYDGITSPGAYWSAASKGSSIARVTSGASYIAPISNINTLIGSISTPYAQLKINGTQVASSTSGQGAGTFGNYPLYLFARAGTSLFLNGNFYGAIIRGAQSDQTSVVKAEKLMATKTGITF